MTAAKKTTPGRKRKMAVRKRKKASKPKAPANRIVVAEKAAPPVSREVYARAMRRMCAVYDAAATTNDNSKHWANADALSADAAASATVRRTLRNRARYEVRNNSWAKGIGLTIANDTIGTGPRLQMLTDSASTNQIIEREFSRWTQAVYFPERLRTMRLSRYQDGEAFCILTQNPGISHDVQLDLQLIEAEQVANPFKSIPDANEIDGVILDNKGNVVEYNVLNDHPGGPIYLTHIDDYITIPAASMVHLFRQERPGQHRGIPDLTPALPLFAILRRYTLAVLEAAESVAHISGVMHTENTSDDPDNVAAEDLFELERNMFLSLPRGWQLQQVKSEQPSTTHDGFVDKVITEISRCLCVPKNIALGDSGGYNYASGRLDDQIYRRAIRVDQQALGVRVLDRILSAWLREYAMVTGNISLLKPYIPHQWFWEGSEHVDPAKEAAAQETRLRNHTTTLAAEFAKQGKDWEVELRQSVREAATEAALREEFGLPPNTTTAAPPTTQNEDTEDEKETP